LNHVKSFLALWISKNLYVIHKLIENQNDIALAIVLQLDIFAKVNMCNVAYACFNA